MSFGSKLAELLKLRYLLFWSAARRSKKRMLLAGLVCLWLVWMVFASANAGLALALLAEHLGRVEAIVGFAALFLYCGGIAASVGLGQSPHKAFSDRNLRRYLLTPFQRTVVRHVTGILDPVWVCCLAVGWGLVIGLAASQRLVLTSGMLAVLLLVIAGYLSSLFLLTMVERLLGNVAGTALLSGLALGFMAALSGLLKTHRTASVLRSSYFNATPAGHATSAMLGAWSASGLWSMSLLVLWCLGLWLAVGAAESVEWNRAGARSQVSDRRLSRWMTEPGGSGIFALIQKSFAYHLRCNRVRLGLVVTIPVLYLYNQWMGEKEGASGAAFGSLAAFFLLGLLATRAMVLNQFGYEGDGFRRYLCAPVSFKSVLFANSIVSVLLGWALVIPALVIFRIHGVIYYDLRWVALLILSALAGSLFFSALGLWISLFAPRPVVFNKIVGSDMSMPGNLAMILGFMAAFGAAYLSSEQFQFSSVLEHWFYAPLGVLVAAGLYAASVAWGARMLKQRRTAIAEIVAVSVSA